MQPFIIVSHRGLEGIEVAPGESAHLACDLVNRPIPPPDLQQPADGFGCKPFPDFAGGMATHKRTVSNEDTT